MEIEREKELVHAYHYDLRNLKLEEENGTPETRIEINFSLLNRDEETPKTSIVTLLQFMLVYENFVISGAMSQVDHILGRLVEEPSEFSQEEREMLGAPLLDLLKRMTYEMTEIALDQPGLNLEF